MKEVDKMLLWSEDLKKEIEGLPFHEDDIRNSFFGLLYDIGCNYYRGYMLFDLMNLISSGEISFSEATYGYKNHIDKGIEVANIQLIYQSYYNSLNRNFLVSTWSNFELCVTTLTEAIATEEEKLHLLEFQFSETIRNLKKSEIHPEDLINLKDTLKKDHLTHVPIVRKTDLLFKKANNYSRNISEDKRFLIFLGKFRNTIHTNFIYYGKDYEYTFNNKVLFKFKNKELVKWDDVYFGSPELYFDIKTTIKEIWKSLVMAIDHQDIILYPVKD